MNPVLAADGYKNRDGKNGWNGWLSELDERLSPHGGAEA